MRRQARRRRSSDDIYNVVTHLNIFVCDNKLQNHLLRHSIIHYYIMLTLKFQ